MYCCFCVYMYICVLFLCEDFDMVQISVWFGVAAIVPNMLLASEDIKQKQNEKCCCLKLYMSFLSLCYLMHHSGTSPALVSGPEEA